MLKTLILSCGLSCGLSLSCLPALAQSRAEADNLVATLSPGWQTATGTRMAGLQLTLAPGWKTYWRSPGEAGLPPLFNWSGSVNVKSVRIHWPSPTVFAVNGMQSIGYHDAVMLPLEVTPRDATLPVQLHAAIDLGICRDICVPASLTLSADLPPSGTPPAETAPDAISAALGNGPLSGDQAGVEGVTCAVDPIADGLRVTASITMPRHSPQETVVFETGQPDIWISAAGSSRQSGTLTAVTEMVAPTGVPFALERAKIRLTILGNTRSVEILGCPAP